MDILISACLTGINCRYDGNNNYMKNFFEKYNNLNFIKICPEIKAGMTTPRNPSEIKDGKVFDNFGKDNTDFFKKGARLTLEKALEKNIKVAILKAKSPSCGKDYIYDGTFTRNLVHGDGLTAKLLKEYGIKIFTENELDDFEDYIKTLINN